MKTGSFSNVNFGKKNQVNFYEVTLLENWFSINWTHTNGTFFHSKKDTKKNNRDHGDVLKCKRI